MITLYLVADSHKWGTDAPELYAKYPVRDRNMGYWTNDDEDDIPPILTNNPIFEGIEFPEITWDDDPIEMQFETLKIVNNG